MPSLFTVQQVQPSQAGSVRPRPDHCTTYQEQKSSFSAFSLFSVRRWEGVGGGKQVVGDDKVAASSIGESALTRLRPRNNYVGRLVVDTITF